MVYNPLPSTYIHFRHGPGRPQECHLARGAQGLNVPAEPPSGRAGSGAGGAQRLPARLRSPLAEAGAGTVAGTGTGNQLEVEDLPYVSLWSHYGVTTPMHVVLAKNVGWCWWCLFFSIGFDMFLIKTLHLEHVHNTNPYLDPPSTLSIMVF